MIFLLLFQYFWTYFSHIAALAGIIGVSVLYKIWRDSSKKIETDSPFGPQNWIPKKPIENDKKKRDAVLKKRFKPDLVKDRDYDTIVIGSGPSGLSTAICLSRLGQKVLVVEQHDVAGGTCHTFVEKGFEFCTGLHYLGKCGIGMLHRFIFDQLTRYQVDFHVLDDACDQVVILGKESTRWYKVKSGIERVMTYLSTMFPKQRRAIEKYYQTMRKCGQEYVLYVVLLKCLPLLLIKFLIKCRILHYILPVFGKGLMEKRLSTYLEELYLTEDGDLHTILLSIAGDYAASSKDTPVMFHGVIIEYYGDGAYFPIGGPSEIVYHMCSEIRERGGEVLVKANVNRILINTDGKAVGVEIGSSKLNVYATNIVSSAGLGNTFHKLLPQHIAMKSPLYSTYENIGPSVGCLTVFLGIDGAASELDLPAGNVWVYKEGLINDVFIDKYYNKSIEDMPDEASVKCISFTSSKDPNTVVTMPGKTTIEVLMFCNPKWFQEWEDERKGHRGQTYTDIKTGICQRVLSLVFSLYPQLDGKVEYMDVGTTATNRYYLGSLHGETYGINASMDRFYPLTQTELRPDIGINGLYVTGTDIVSCGVSTAAVSGLLTASAMTKRNLLKEIEKAYNLYNNELEVPGFK